MRVGPAFLALSAAVIVASAPALGGSWVYHDRIQLGHPMLDGWDDVVPSFWRTSDDYQSHTRAPGGIAGGTTYRPVVTITYVILNATFGLSPLAQHILSLLIHLAVIYLLLRLAAVDRHVSWAALLPVTIFALHPSNIETYGWINARADTAAGLALSSVVVLCAGRQRLLALFLILVAGALCKETFLFAAAVPIVAYRLRPFEPRRMAGDFAALVASAAVLFGLRALTASMTVPQGFDATLMLERAVHVVRLAIETWVVPWPHAMRLVAREANRPLGATDLLAAALPLLVAVVLAARGDLRRAGLIGGALLCLAPTLLVGDSFWLGFDRFLYLSAILLVAAALPASGNGRVWIVLNLAAAVLLGVASFLAARAYRSHDDFAAALIADRPDDPTGYVVSASAALEHGDRAGAGALLDRMPADDLPVPVAHAAAYALISVGRPREAATLIERAASAHPRDGYARFDLLTLRAGERRWDEVAEIARSFAGDPARKQAVMELLTEWRSQGAIPPEAAARVEAALSNR